jgi:hypothetical protein
MMLQKIKEYVREMGVSDSFYDAMVNTEVEDVQLYGEEIHKLVPKSDPTQDEIFISHLARAPLRFSPPPPCPIEARAQKATP